MCRHCVILLEVPLHLDKFEKSVAHHLKELQDEVDNRSANPNAARIVSKIEAVQATQVEYSTFLSNLEQLLNGRPLDKDTESELYLERNDFLAKFGGCVSASMAYSVPTPC